MSGNEIVVTKRGRPVARLVPLEPDSDQHRWPTELQHRAKLRDDLVEPAASLAEWGLFDATENESNEEP